jgi:hypothetical protein
MQPLAACAAARAERLAGYGGRHPAPAGRPSDGAQPSPALRAPAAEPLGRGRAALHPPAGPECGRSLPQPCRLLERSRSPGCRFSRPVFRAPRGKRGCDAFRSDRDFRRAFERLCPIPGGKTLRRAAAVRRRRAPAVFGGLRLQERQRRSGRLLPASQAGSEKIGKPAVPLRRRRACLLDADRHQGRGLPTRGRSATTISRHSAWQRRRGPEPAGPCRTTGWTSKMRCAPSSGPRLGFIAKPLLAVSFIDPCAVIPGRPGGYDKSARLTGCP